MLDVVGEAIACVELLYRDGARQELDEARQRRIGRQAVN